MTKKDVERFQADSTMSSMCEQNEKDFQDDMLTTTTVAIESESLLMDEGAQRVESYFERARVREETGSGGTATSSGSATVVTHAQTPKRKAED